MTHERKGVQANSFAALAPPEFLGNKGTPHQLKRVSVVLNASLIISNNFREVSFLTSTAMTKNGTRCAFIHFFT